MSGLSHSGNTYNISSAADLIALSNYVNDGATQNLTFKLTTDIVMTGEENFTPIGYDSGNYFRGTFDGQGHTITGLDIRFSDENIGLFGKTKDATIKNLTLETGIIAGRNYVGALVGYCAGTTIDNCQVKNVTIDGHPYSPDAYSINFHDVGGLVGEYKDGTITNCTVTDGRVSSNYPDSSNAVLGQDTSGSSTTLGVTTSNVDCYCQWTYTNLGGYGGGYWYCTISNKSGEYTATVTKSPYMPAVYGNLPAVQNAAWLWGCGAEKIKTLILNDVTTLDGDLIGGLTGLQTIDLTNCHEFTTINRRDFINVRDMLKEVILPASVTTISDNAFDLCASLTTLDLSKCTGLTTIENATFYGCSNLTSVTLPASVAEIIGTAFSSCPNLTTVNIVVPEYKTLYANGTILNGTGTVNIRNLIGENGVSIGYVESQTVSYLDANGNTTSTTVSAIGGNYNNLSAGTYFVDGNFNPYELTLGGEVNLILGDNANATIYNISGGTLNIYSQGGGGKLTVRNSITGNVNFYGGQFSAETVSGNANIT